MLSDQSTTTPTQEPSVGDDENASSRLSDDKVFHLLQNRRRRDVIRYLRGKDGTVSMRDIAEQVAAWEHDTSVQALTSDERQRVYIPLYQNHLPKLDEEGVIDYNQSRGTVERTALADQLEEYLTGDDPASAPTAEAPSVETDDDWTDAYLGATGLASGFFMLAVFGVPAVGPVSDLLFASLMLVTFATITCAHVFFRSKPDFR